MSEYIVDTFGIVQDFADLHGDMSTPLYQAIMDVMVSRQREEVVRCRDCKHYESSRWYESVIFPPLGTDIEHVCAFFADGAKVSPDGFCAWGERREDA